MPGRGRGQKAASQPQGVGPGPTASVGGQGRGGGGRGGRGRSAVDPIGDPERLGTRQVDTAPVNVTFVGSALDVTHYEHQTASSESVPLEMFDVMEPTQQELDVLSSTYSLKSRDDVAVECADDKRFDRKKIVLKANHFKVKMNAREVWQYKIAFLHPEKGPAVKTKEDRQGIFEAFVEQYVEGEELVNQSGFDKTIARKTNYSMVFDGTDLAYHYVDLTKNGFWQQRQTRMNWNAALRNPIANSEEYVMASNRKKGINWEFWKKEAESANKSMLSEKEKTRNLVRLDVKFRPAGRGRSYDYPIMITQTKRFGADLINDVSVGKSRDQSVIQLIDVILRYASSKRNHIFGSTIFPKQDFQKEHSLGGGAHLWQGYSQSVRPNSWKGLTLNIDGKMSGFYQKENLMDFAMKILNCNDCSSMTVSALQEKNNMRLILLEKALKGYVFTTNYGVGVQYKISGVHLGSADTTDFEWNGKKTTVADYYANHLNVKLKYPRAPLIRVGSKEKKGVLPPKTKLFPMELCLLNGAQKVKQMNEAQISTLIKSCLTSDKNQQHIEKLAITAKKATQEACNEWGIKIGGDEETRMLRIENAEQLAPPKLEFGGGKTELPMTGRGECGDFDFRNRRFFKAATLKAKEWAILGFGRMSIGEREFVTFAKGIGQKGIELGMNIEEELPFMNIVGDLKQVISFMEEKKETLKLLIVVLPRKSTEDYSFVKKHAELVHGVMTQCVLEKTLKKQDRRTGGYDTMTAANILLKINHKLSGTNTRLAKVSRPSIFDKPVMVIGASLSHSMFGGISVAAVTASIDSGASVYNGFVGVQKRNDMFLIHDLDKFIQDALLHFYKATNSKKPEAIIYYRDGLSEGQYDKAVKYEITMLRRGILAKKFQGDGEYKPTITMLSVQRRHNVKFFCDPDKAIGRANNVPAGTVVDHDVTSSEHFDFYMYCHAGMMGTSRPAHYMLLHDDNNLTQKTIQVLSYYLCHSYARCTKTMAMPICVYYAQLLAQRGRYWLRQQGYVDDNSMSTASGGSTQTNVEELNTKLKVHEDLQYEMFFC